MNPQDKILVNSSFLELAMELASAASEAKALKIIKQNIFTNNPENWVPYGRNAMNWSMIGAQAIDPIPAFTEKVTNSIDAVLLRACRERDIDPRSEQAPQTMKDALRDFFDVPEGEIGYLAREHRTKLAEESIHIVVTGDKRSPCYDIIDFGEGQAPYEIENTFVSLGRDNKAKIRFVQGKYNMGGSAALSFSGENNVQLIITRRAPKLRKCKEDHLWGFTFVRMRAPRQGERDDMPVIEYFYPKGRMAAFEAESLPLLSLTKNELYSTPMSFGSFIKLYDYDMGSGARDVEFGLNNALCKSIYTCALPIRLYDTRVRSDETSKGKRTFSGTNVRLNDPEDEEPRWLMQNPWGFDISFSNIGNFRIEAIPFKQEVKWLGKAGIWFIRNGQVHHEEDYWFFYDIGLPPLKGRMLIVVDCTHMEMQKAHLIFSTARDRMKKKHSVSRQILAKIKDEIRTHQGIKEFSRQIHEENIRKKAADSKDIEAILTQMIKMDPAIAELFGLGSHLKTLRRSLTDGEKKKFKGKTFPILLECLKGIKKGMLEIPTGGTRDILAATDANNDYLTRVREKGSVVVSPELLTCAASLSDGLAKFKITLPENITPGNELDAFVGFNDVEKIKPLTINFKIRVVEKREVPPPTVKPPSEVNPRVEDDEPAKPLFTEMGHLGLPDHVEVVKDGENGDHYNRLDMTNEDGFAIEANPDNKGFVLFVNMSNKYYEDFMLRNKSLHEEELIKKQYIISLKIFAVSLWNRVRKNGREGESVIKNASAAFAQISLFLVRSLSKSSLVVTSRENVEVETE